jgi:hypothetical protein
MRAIAKNSNKYLEVQTEQVHFLSTKKEKVSSDITNKFQICGFSCKWKLFIHTGVLTKFKLVMNANETMNRVTLYKKKLGSKL